MAAPKQPADEESPAPADPDDDAARPLEDCPGLDALFYGLTLAVFAASLLADAFVVIEHWFNAYKSWAYFTVGLAFVPSCFVQILSLKWYQATSGELKQHQWISHVFHLAIIHRFCLLLNRAIKTIKTPASPKQRDWIFKVESDAFTLNLFTAMLVSIPQIIFQVYVMAMLQHISFWTSTSVITSLCSLTWALTSYSLLTNRANQDESQFTWSSMMMQGFWRGGMLASRIAALVLAAIYLKAWILVIFAIHTLGTTLLVIQQTVNSRLTTIDELVNKCLIGAVYFFDFLRLMESQIKYHVCIFYAVIIVENAIFFVLYLVYFKGHYHANVLIVSSVMILGGSFIGAISMIMHYCMFQNIKTVNKSNHLNPEMALKNSPAKNMGRCSLNKKWNNESLSGQSTGSISPDTTADKKSLLTNIVQSAELTEKGIVNSSFAKSDETNVTIQVVMEDSQVNNVEISLQKLKNHAITEKMSDDNVCKIDVSLEKMDQIKSSSTESLHRQKRRGICSELELDLKQKECNIDLDPQSCSQKRRGICSLTQLGLELITDEDNYVEKSFSLDKLKSNSDVSINIEDKSLDSGIIESLPIKSLATDNCKVMLPEGIVTRGRLNTPVASDKDETSLTTTMSEKDRDSRKQEEETMSHVTSIHDYENLCPLGVARPPWCIRSWKGYTDIETYIHDDSIVRDRRRDTLTSTATLSSDFSDATYASLPLRRLIRRSRQDDYLDTLIYDLVDWETASNSKPLIDEVSKNIPETVKETQEQTNLFSAKPIVIDEKGGMLSLDTILEEREDSGFELTGLRNMNSLSKPSGCTVSSLVATIDEIRRCAVDNSPRHIYHRTESQWEDIEQKILLKRARLAKVLFTNERNNYTLGYTEPWAESFLSQPNSDKLNIIREMTNCCLKDVGGKTPLINAILSDSPILGPKTDVQPCEADHLLEEDNVYVDMNALGAQKCSSEEHIKADNCMTNKDMLLQKNSSLAQSKDSGFVEKRTDGCVRKKVAFFINDEVINDSDSEKSVELPRNTKAALEEPQVSVIEPTALSFGVDRRRHTANRPRRKFSLLRERFELPQTSETEFKNELQISCSGLNKLITDEPDTIDLSLDKQVCLTTSKSQAEFSEDLKEKRSIFLKQVLSPPRFQGWSKKRTFSPNAKIIPKAH